LGVELPVNGVGYTSPNLEREDINPNFTVNGNGNGNGGAGSGNNGTFENMTVFMEDHTGDSLFRQTVSVSFLVLILSYVTRVTHLYY
jgi:hypothetical protein